MASLLAGRTKRWHGVACDSQRGNCVFSRRIEAFLDALLGEAVVEDRENLLAPLGIRRPAR